MTTTLIADAVPYEVTYRGQTNAERLNRYRHPDAPLPPPHGHVTASLPTWIVSYTIEFELEDGRRWRCRVSSDGALTDVGGLRLWGVARLNWRGFPQSAQWSGRAGADTGAASVNLKAI